MILDFDKHKNLKKQEPEQPLEPSEDQREEEAKVKKEKRLAYYDKKIGLKFSKITNKLEIIEEESKQASSGVHTPYSYDTIFNSDHSWLPKNKNKDKKKKKDKDVDVDAKVKKHNSKSKSKRVEV